MDLGRQRSDLPPDIVEPAHLRLLDIISFILAATDTPIGRAARGHWAPPQSSGLPRRTTM
jgi:hypothetical protein